VRLLDLSNGSMRSSDISQEAEARLRRSGFSTLRRIDCETQGNVLRLRGCLPSDFLKHLAQTIVANVEGARTVLNEIEVIAPSRCEAAERFT
jgi:osmotically-inducible protein OsmY